MKCKYSDHDWRDDQEDNAKYCCNDHHFEVRSESELGRQDHVGKPFPIENSPGFYYVWVKTDPNRSYWLE